ncbi:hypothetical protein CRUP_036127 [Coryphaenoides rupestris]|nr:hypothetical protein CRUP_036127 [Coryphaenoides rupestris]
MSGSFRKIAGGCVALVAVCLAAVATGAEDQGNGRGKTVIAGNSAMNLGQQSNTWRPLVKTTANLTDVRSIKSTFEFRTFDPEGVVFYGDNKCGAEWFVLSLHDGVPEMQIYKADVLISVTGGPRLDDGRWHLMEVSTEGKFVLLEVDGSKALMVGLHSATIEEVLTGQLRLALGGILIDHSKLLVPFRPEMDGCVRHGSWLNLSTAWEMEQEGTELRPCVESIRRGSFFPGSGFAVFNTSALGFEGLDEPAGASCWRQDLGELDGTASGGINKAAEPKALLLATIGLFYGSSIFMTELDSKTMLALTVHERSLRVSLPQGSEVHLEIPGEFLHTWSMWRGGQLAVGGLLGEGTVGSNFLTGCLENIIVQGKRLDLDLADKDASISSHSCPASRQQTERQNWPEKKEDKNE